MERADRLPVLHVPSELTIRWTQVKTSPKGSFYFYVFTVQKQLILIKHVFNFTALHLDRKTWEKSQAEHDFISSQFF